MPKVEIQTYYFDHFAENCMKLKKSSNDRGLGAQVPCAPFRSGTGGVLLPLNPVT